MSALLSTILDQCQTRWHAQEARRLFHGRGQTFAGLEQLVINHFPPYLQIAVFGEPQPVSLDALQAALLKQAAEQGVEIAGIVLQRRDGRATRSDVVYGAVPDEIQTFEHGLKYWIQPTRNQNVGLFLDMGHIREWLAPQVSGARVLNLFAYTCAFSVSALAHGAELVVNNDMSKNALALGERNHQLNDHDLRRVRMVPHNLFKSWWKLKQMGPYDFIIIDPPTNQRGSFVAEKSYGQVLKRIPELAATGASVLACLNSPFLDSDFLVAQMQRWCPDCRLDSRFPLHPDFPDSYPERALKVMHFTYHG